MSGTAATTLATIESMQTALSVLSALQLCAYRVPPSCTVTNGSSWDMIIVGGGSAGSVLASRLSENASIKVLLIESGTFSPLESALPAVFPVLPLSAHDYNYTSVNDDYTAQNLIDSTVSLTQGKMLGGSSALHHMIHVQGNQWDFEEWVNISGSDIWSYENLQPYFRKMENCLDKDVMNSTYAQYHGTTGPMMLTREPNSLNVDILNAFEEIGHTTKVDVSGPTTFGYSEPLFNIANGERQSNDAAYLGLAINRTNLCVALSSTVTKILISNGTTTGVQLVDSSGNTLEVYATKEVIVSAGAIATPQILILSGIGPKDQVESLGIPLVADLPVGKNLADHAVSPMVYLMEASNETAAPTNPHVFPVPTTTGYAAIDSTQTHPDYQTINLLFPQSSAALVQLCSNVFKFKNSICDAMYEASVGRKILFVVINLLKPVSRGDVMVNSSNPAVHPSVYTGTFSNSSDLTLMGKSLEDFNKILGSTYFTNINASFVDFGFCSNATTTTEYWECYAVAMSATMWHYSGTAAMGYVLDSNLKVKNVTGLRVACSAAMPTMTSGNINAGITVLAERAAALIQEEWGLA